MAALSELLAGVGIGNRHGERAETDRDQDDVEHVTLPFGRGGASRTNPAVR
jgi:hypothetical protein